MAYSDTKSADEKILSADWNAFVDDAVEPAGHQHSGAAQDGNGSLTPLSVVVTQTGTGAGLTVTRDNASGAAAVLTFRQANQSDTSDIIILDQHGSGDNLVLQYRGTTFASFKNDGVKILGLTTREDKAGSDCSGSDGDASRVLTLTNTSLTGNEQVYIDGQLLTPTTDYTPSHLAASTTITFVGKVWDTQKISVIYFTSS